MLQAEILVQYGMRSKAIERLQRIQELFPHEEERNQDLQQLYLTAGLTPQRSETAAPAGSAAKAAPAAATPARASAPASESADVNSFTRVAEITRKLYRQSNADAVMSTAVERNRSAMEGEPLRGGDAQARTAPSRCERAPREGGRLVTPEALEKVVSRPSGRPVSRRGL